MKASTRTTDRVPFPSGIDCRNVGPGWAEKAIAQLEADAAAGAVGVGEIGKGLGLSTKKADGARLKIDDPDLDPECQAAARLKLPVFIHTADPQDFWHPIDYHNQRLLVLPPEGVYAHEHVVVHGDAVIHRLRAARQAQRGVEQRRAVLGAAQHAGLQQDVGERAMRALEPVA